MPPDQPPNAANGAWFTPSTAYGQVFLSHATSLPVSRFNTFIEPGSMTAPTLSITFDCFGSIASTPISPQSSVSAQWPEMNALRVSPTSRLISFGGPYCVDCL